MRASLITLMLSFACSASAQVLLHSETESELKDSVVPPEGVVNLILRDEPSDASYFGECMAEGSRTAREFFTSSLLDLNHDGSPDYFVRPALRPYCGAFYGAHLFRYWLVTSHRKGGRISYRIVFKSGGDEATVLSHSTNGYRDLVLVGHNALESYTSTWHFNGSKYEPGSCTKRVFQQSGPSKLSEC